VNFLLRPSVYFCVSPTSAQLLYPGNLLPSRGRGLFLRCRTTSSSSSEGTRAREQFLSPASRRPPPHLLAGAVHTSRTCPPGASSSPGAGAVTSSNSHARRAIGTLQYFLRSSLTKTTEKAGVMVGKAKRVHNSRHPFAAELVEGGKVEPFTLPDLRAL